MTGWFISMNSKLQQNLVSFLFASPTLSFVKNLGGGTLAPSAPTYLHPCVACFQSVCYVLDRGQDFRKSFKMIGGLRALLSAPFMALSASAPPDIEAEIIVS